MINCGARWTKKYNMAHRVTQFIIGLHKFIIGLLHNFSSGYAILVPSYKFRGRQFEIPGYITVGGRCGLSYAPTAIHRLLLHKCKYVSYIRFMVSCQWFINMQYTMNKTSCLDEIENCISNYIYDVKIRIYKYWI